MILEYHGHKYSSSYLSKICHSTVEGVSMLGISETAKKLGLNVMCGHLSIDTLNHIQLPFHNHEIVVIFANLYMIYEEFTILSTFVQILL